MIGLSNLSIGIGRRRHGGGGGVSGMKIGINTVSIFGGNFATPFNDRFVGAPNNPPNWRTSEFSADQGEVPNANLDSEKWISSLPAAGAWLHYVFYVEDSTTYNMTWVGNMSDHIFGSGVTVNSFDAVARTANITIGTGRANPYIDFLYTFTDTVNYPKHFQCTPAGSSGLLTTQYVTEMNRYNGTKRFLKMQPSVEDVGGSNAMWGGGTFASPLYRPTWATRNLTTMGDWGKSFGGGGDGVPIEHMVAIGNAYTGDAVHFCIPYNASDDYITGLANYVRDNLTSKTVYVEFGNEVWNFSYPQATQAFNEAADANISARYPTQGGDGDTPRYLRYIDKAVHCMKLWTDSFAAASGGSQLSRLKPMLAFQHVNSSTPALALAYANSQGWLTYNSAPLFKAYATAPYWSAQGLDATFTGTPATFFAAAKLGIDAQAAHGVSHKTTADLYGWELISYEGSYGHDINDLPTLTAIKTDTGMYDEQLYYLQSMQQAGYSRLTLMDICQPLAVPDGIYGHVFPSILGMPAISKTTLPQLKANIDYEAGTRELFDAVYGTQQVNQNDPNGTSFGAAPTGLVLTGTVFSLADNDGGRVAIDPTTGQLSLVDHTLLTATGARSVTVRKTNALAANSPHDQTVSYTVNAPVNNTHKYRYYRLRITAVQQFHDPEIAELEIAATVGGADTTAGQMITASSSNGTTPPTRLIDDNTGTTWLVGGGYTYPVDIILDYSATSGNWIAANQLKITASGTPGNAPKDFTFSGSDDNSTYTDLITQTNQTFTANQTLTYTV